MSSTKDKNHLRWKILQFLVMDFLITEKMSAKVRVFALLGTLCGSFKSPKKLAI